MEKIGTKKKALTEGLFYYTVILLIFLVGSFWFMTTSTIPFFRGGDVIFWEKWGPIFIFGTAALLLMWSKFIVANIRIRRAENTDHVSTKLFRHDEHLILGLLFLGIIAPFIFQPIIDYVVTPSLGYEYCEVLTERQSTFGFQTYAYVKDAALCVVSPDAD